MAQAIRKSRPQVVHLHVERVRAPARRAARNEIGGGLVLIVGFVCCVIFAAVLFYGRQESTAAEDVVDATTSPSLVELIQARQESLESVK
jgi:hypothetical protein